MDVTRSLLAEQVKRLLGESEASRYDIREIALAVGQAFDERIRFEYFEAASAGEREIPSEFIREYEAPVQQSAKGEYADLPHDYLRLPKGRGIFSVGYGENTFVQSSSGTGTLLRHHPAYRMEGEIAYYPENGRLYFRRPISRIYPQVLIKLVRPLESFGEEEEFSIPRDMQLAIVERAYNLLRAKPAPDRVNDNTDTTRTA